MSRPQYPMRSVRRRAGMTLVEIMVVITIIVSLMAVLAVNVLGAMDEANRETTKIKMRQVEQAVQMYAIKHKGQFPSTGDGLQAASKYMPNPGEIPKDEWGGEFIYRSPGGNNRAYDIISYGKDGKEGGEDAGADIESFNMDGDVKN